MIVTVGNAHDAVTLTKQRYIYHTTLSYCLYSNLLIVSIVTTFSILNSECQCRSLTITYTHHTRTYTHTNTLQSTGTCFSHQIGLFQVLYIPRLYERKAANCTTISNISPWQEGVISAAHTPSANHPSSSLSSLGRNLYCCCRIWASFFRASSSSRSFLSISSWAAMI